MIARLARVALSLGLAGTPCTCDSGASTLACVAGPDDTTLQFGDCRVRIDDPGRRFHDVRSHCELAGAPCSMGRYCCAGLECGAGPEPRCTVRAADAGR